MAFSAGGSGGSDTGAPRREMSPAARRLSLFGEQTWEFRGYRSGNAYCGHAFVDDRPRLAVPRRFGAPSPVEDTTVATVV